MVQTVCYCFYGHRRTCDRTFPLCSPGTVDTWHRTRRWLFHYRASFCMLMNTQYRSWRDSGVLSSVIPILTVAILGGWSLLCFTLGRWSGLGYLRGAVGGELSINQSDYPRSQYYVPASGLYALTFGLLGLLPAPKVHRS
jgi:hypothetical protein